ncbi:MAG: endopeptidase La [SAR324 cluster bacterium]|nr:endopeptidase La [SAR324 cluster bacterium]
MANIPKKSKDNKKEKILLIDSEGNVITLAELPLKIPILPLYHRPMFPGILTMVGSSVATSEWIQQTLEKTDNIIGLLMVDPEKRDSNGEWDEVKSSDDFCQMGTVAYVLNWVELPDKSCQFMLSTLQRFTVSKMTKRKRNFTAEVNYIEEPEPNMTEEVKACGAAIVTAIKEIIPHNPIFSQEMSYLLSQVDINDPFMLTDLAASVTNAKGKDLQEILETSDLSTRMEKTLLLLREEYDLSVLKEQINQKIEDQMSKHQREFFLREQLKAIKIELGIEQNRKQVDLQRFREKFKSLTLTEEAQKRVSQEMDRYETLDDQSPENHVVFQYLEWLSSMPWGVFSKDRLSLTRAERILNQDHYGLKDVKKRILEFIGVSKLKGSVKGSIVCLVGPPGVGKTSLGKSVARALGREFYRFSLGGMHDESELKGHRRTYVGSLPGRLIYALRDAKTSNPVIMLDELDKVGNSYRGDPYSVLLEVLDPEQNQEFLDHYLDVRFDLSNVLFIATANILDPIHSALLDRMEIIRLSGYIPEEKIQIAQRHLLPKTLLDSGLTGQDVIFEKKAVQRIILEYAREAGVRNLEKKLNAILRSIATSHARGKTEQVTITPDNLESFLGKPIFNEETYHSRPMPGVVRGLAWTSLGGTTLYIESSQMDGKGNLKLTGQLGDVMKESSSIAHTYVQSFLKSMGEKPGFFRKNAIHLHVPAGATPKDGPSAGIAMAVSLLSLALEQPVDPDLAMTGELTLKGYVLPVGGIKEKLIGAKLAGIRKLIFPRENEKDYDELPAYLKRGLTVHLVSHFREVAEIALDLEL